MILQALNDYYARKSDANDPLCTQDGFEWKAVDFLIGLDSTGTFVDIRDFREPSNNGKKKFGKLCQIPSYPIGKGKSSTNFIAHLLADTCDYSLGISQKKLENEIKQKKDLDNCKKKLVVFWREIEKFNQFAGDKRLNGLIHFLQSNPQKIIEDKMKDSSVWDDLKKSKNPFIGFAFVDNDWIPLTTLFHDQIALLKKQVNQDDCEKIAICLVSGEKTSIARLHPTIPQFGGGKTRLVSFQENSGYDFYDKRKAFNAPVSAKIASQYTKALDLLLNKQDFSHCNVGTSTICFWSQKEENCLEHQFGFLFGMVKDNPDKNVLEMKQLFQSIKNGNSVSNMENNFFVLGLEKINDARTAIRFWSENSYAEIQKKIKSYFEDIAIDSEDNIFPLNMYLRTLVLESGTPPKRSTEDLPPNLAADLMRAILNGSAFPQRILNSAISRIRAECSRNKDESRRDNLNNIDCCRTALLKAYLNRKKEKTEKEITMSLDSTNTNQAYRLGRLFAAFEMLQRKAIGKDINATIKDRYYGAASSTPCTVFPQLFKLHLHHLEKVDQPIKNIYDNLIQDIMSEISADGLPANLSLEDQARFAIGYYHQKLAIADDIKKRVENKTGA